MAPCAPGSPPCNCVQTHKPDHALCPPQAALGRIPVDPITLPGRAPGMYSGAYVTLGRLLGLVADARLQLLEDGSRGGAWEAAERALRQAVALEDGLG